MRNLYKFSLEKWLSFAFIMSLPLQVRHFISGPVSPEEAEYGRQFIEWTSTFVYLSDIIFIALLVVFLLKKDNRKNFLSLNKLKEYVLWIAILSFIQFMGAIDGDSSLYRSIKLVELFLVFAWASSTKVRPEFIYKSVVVMGVIQAVIAIGQFTLQKSLGLKRLVESPLQPLDQNVAHIMTDTELFIRGYGLLPSPNILAFFLVVSILFLLYLFIRNKVNIYIFTISFYVLCWGLILTFARGSIGFGVVSVVVFLAWLFYINYGLRDTIKRCLFISLLCIIPITAMFSSTIYERFLIAIQHDNSVSERIESYNAATNYPKNLIWGVGGGNTIYYQNTVDQPIHNSFVLFFYEWGIIVGILFIVVFYVSIKRGFLGNTIEDKLFFSIFLLILLVGNVDHFLITIQQSALLLWTTKGLASNEL